MNKNQIEGKWLQFRGKVKEEWNELTDDEIDAAEGRVQQLAGKIQERYGITEEQARKRLSELESESKFA